MALVAATSHANEVLATIPEEELVSAFAATLRIAAEEAGHHPAKNIVEALALSTENVVARMVANKELPYLLTQAQAFAFLTIHFNSQGKYLEALESAWWMKHYETSHLQIMGILSNRRRASHAGKQPRAMRLKVTNERLLQEVRRLQRSGMPERNWASSIQKRLQRDGIEISEEAIRKRLKNLLKKSRT